MKKMATLRIESGCSMMLNGCTRSGKTTWLFRLLKQLPNMFKEPVPSTILYCYGVFQPMFNEMENTIANISFHKGIPTSKVVENLDNTTLIILDDLAYEVMKNNDISVLFTQGCHHRGISVIFITQNLYTQGMKARTIALNTTYLVLFKSLRDMSTLQVLNHQIYPTHPGFLTAAYEDCMNTPYGYLLIDLHPYTNSDYRVRTFIFPNEDPVIYKFIKRH